MKCFNTRFNLGIVKIYFGLQGCPFFCSFHKLTAKGGIYMLFDD